MQLQYMTARWKTFRRLVLQHYPFCGECRRNPSKVADHIVPARAVVAAFLQHRLFPFDRWAGFYILANTWGLCHTCHNSKTHTEMQRDWTGELEALIAKYRK